MIWVHIEEKYEINETLLYGTDELIQCTSAREREIEVCERTDSLSRAGNERDKLKYLHTAAKFKPE